MSCAASGVLRPRTVLSAAVGAALAVAAFSVSASSHREAPFITTIPKVDATDFYMFRSYEAGRDGYVMLVANYQPLQDPYGGPNYFSMDPNALYEIHIDNNGDAKEDITFQFRFQNANRDTQLNVGGKNVSIPLVINGGAINAPGGAGLNVRETYSVNVVRGNRRTGTRSAVTNANGGGSVFDKPIDNVGNKSIPSYEAYARQHIYSINIPGCNGAGKMFVGQRKDPFVVNLGETFDLINLNPLGAPDAKKDSLADKNVTSLILEVPTSCLTAGNDPVIGAWTSASVRQARLVNGFQANAKTTRASVEGGPWVQVSRLSMPLVNEVVIGLKDKDRFNASHPQNDGQFADYVTNPTLPALIQTIFGSAAPAPTKFPRQDLVVAFLTGVPGLNKPASVTPSEMMRLNTSVAVKAKGAQANLGVLGGDVAGYPNGRRPGDDVVDISLRVAMGVLCTLNNPSVFGCAPADAPAGAAPLTDGAKVDDGFFDAAFPYLKSPIPGSPQ